MGYSNYELDNTAVEDIGHKPYTIHQTSYAKVEEVFMDNIVSFDDELTAPDFVGKPLLIIANYYFLPTRPTV